MYNRYKVASIYELYDTREDAPFSKEHLIKNDENSFVVLILDRIKREYLK